MGNHIKSLLFPLKVNQLKLWIVLSGCSERDECTNTQTHTRVHKKFILKPEFSHSIRSHCSFAATVAL